MDAFYASVEQRDFPEYQGKPIAVGGSPDGRGVVATASYEARKFGIKSAMPSRQALQLCPELIFIRPRFDAYKKASEQIRNIFSRYTDIIEPLSLDEAYLDVSEDKQGIGSAIRIAELIKEDIKRELRLTASAGVSSSKFVAKIASDLNKPDGLTFIGPSKIEKFMEALAVERFFGVGKVTAKKMNNMGLHTGADLKKLSEAEILRYFGKSGKFYYNIVRGIDNREVQPRRQTKSQAAEDTFEHDLLTIPEMHTELGKLADKLFSRLQSKQLWGRTITLKVKFHDFRIITRNRSFATPVSTYHEILDTAKYLLDNLDLENKKIRLLGISVSNFEYTGSAPFSPNGQLRLFPD